MPAATEYASIISGQRVSRWHEGTLPEEHDFGLGPEVAADQAGGLLAAVHRPDAVALSGRSLPD